MQRAHEGDVDVLEPVRRDEVQAHVHQRVLQPEPLAVAGRPRALGAQLLLEEAVDVAADDVERLLGVQRLAVPRRVHQRHLQLVLAHRDAKGVEGLDRHRRARQGAVAGPPLLLLLIVIVIVHVVVVVAAGALANRVRLVATLGEGPAAHLLQLRLHALALFLRTARTHVGRRSPHT